MEGSLIVHIMGGVPDENKSINKLPGYYQPTNGYLITNLSVQILGVRPENAKIFAYGTEEDYKTYVHTNNKCYYQLDLEHYYEVDVSNICNNFNYFTDFKEVLAAIDTLLLKNQSSPLLLFLDDHGDRGYFSTKKYFQLYQILNEHRKNKIMIFNDSSNSGCLIDMFQWCSQIYAISERKQYHRINTRVLTSIKNLLLTIFDFQSTKDIRKGIETAYEMIDFFQSKVQVQNKEVLKLLIEEGHQYVQLYKKDKSLDISKEVFLSDGKGSILNLFTKISGVTTIKDIIYFIQIIESLDDPMDITFRYTYLECFNVFTKSNLDMFLDLSNNELESFHDFLSIFGKFDDANFQIPPHPNIEIISSTDSKSLSLSFSSIRTNEFSKVFPGSPALGAFIKEAFMNLKLNQVNFEAIEDQLAKINGNVIDYQTKEIPYEEKNLRKNWMQLKPQHYQHGDPIFKAKENLAFLSKISKMRKYSYLTSQMLENIARKICPEVVLDSTQTHDMFADIVAIVASIQHANSRYRSLLFSFDSYNILGLSSIKFVTRASLKISNNPTEMIAICMNVLQKATNDDISTLARLKEEAFGFALVISSLLMQEGCYKKTIMEINKLLNKMNLEKSNFDKFIEELEEIENESLIRVQAEKYLLILCSLSTIHGDIISRASGITQILYNILGKDNLSALKTLSIISNRMDVELVEKVEDIFIDAIANACKDAKLGEEFHFAVFSEMSFESVIKALIISCGQNDKNCCDKILNIFKACTVKDNYDSNEKIILSILTSNSSEKDILKSIREESNIKAKEIKYMSEIAEKETRMNMKNRIKSTIPEKIAKTIQYLKSVNRGNTKRLETIIQASLNELNNLWHQMNQTCHHPNIPSIDLSIDTREIKERAAKEMLYVSDLLKVWDPKNEDFISSNAKMSETVLDIMIETMIARSIGIVEIVPIASRCIRFKGWNEKYNQTPYPNVDEIMALLSCVRYKLPDEEKKRKRFRYQKEAGELIRPIQKSIQIEVPKDPSKNIVRSKIILYDYADDKDDFQLGCGAWYEDAWIVFLYRFNVHLKSLGIQYDKNSKYEGFSPLLDVAYREVISFYPISRIEGIQRQRKNLMGFFANNSLRGHEIVRAFVQAFEEVDQIVTPVFFNARTFKEYESK